MSNEVLCLDTSRDGYSVDQVVDCTMTVGELLDFLSDYEEDTKVVFRNDNGYTFGYISEGNFELSEEE